MNIKSNFMNNSLHCIKSIKFPKHNINSKIKEIIHKNYRNTVFDRCKVLQENNNNSFATIPRKYTYENTPSKYLTIQKDENKIYNCKCLPRKNVIHIKTISYKDKLLTSNTNSPTKDNIAISYITPKKPFMAKSIYNNNSSYYSKTACTSNENKHEKKRFIQQYNISSKNLYPKFNEEEKNEITITNNRYHMMKIITLDKNEENKKIEEEKKQEIKKRNERRDKETQRLLINVLKKKCPICKKLIIHYAFRIHYLSHPSQILSWIYLGNFLNANNNEEIRQLNITYVLNCAYEIKLFDLPKDINYCHLNIIDNPQENLLQYFDKAFSFIESARKNSENILIHCKMGRSRSTSILIAYMIKYFGFSAQKALEFIKLRRKEINPNIGFIGQLYSYERYILKFRKNSDYNNNDLN